MAALCGFRAIWLSRNEAGLFIDARERPSLASAMWRLISRIGIHTA